MSDTKFLTRAEVAQILCTSPETLRYWAWRGEGPKGFKSGRKWLYTPEDVDAYITEKRGGVPAAPVDEPESQLDRIESKLDQILSMLEASG